MSSTPGTSLEDMAAIAADLGASFADLEARVGALEAHSAADSIAVPNVFLINSITGVTENEAPTLPKYLDTFGSLAAANWLQSPKLAGEALQPLINLLTPTPGEGLKLVSAANGGPEAGRMLLTLPQYYVAGASQEGTLLKPLLGPYLAVMHFHTAATPEGIPAEAGGAKPRILALDTGSWPATPGKALAGSSNAVLDYNVQFTTGALKAKPTVHLTAGGYGENSSATAELTGANLTRRDWWLTVVAEPATTAEVANYKAQLWNGNPLVFGSLAEPVVYLNQQFSGTTPNRVNPLFHARLGVGYEGSKAQLEAELAAGVAAIRSLLVAPLVANVYPSE